DAAERVELLDTAMLSGDLKAGTLTVAAGARIRGHIDSGWGDGADARGAKGKDGKPDLDATP
ncbi:MAG TPA: polymer-forming cytoskeletal protein, partial [Luteimonas sp.]|nr:polymer-forming cytoskeletal protein [Luteimonas sp.]